MSASLTRTLVMIAACAAAACQADPPTKVGGSDGGDASGVDAGQDTAGADASPERLPDLASPADASAADTRWPGSCEPVMQNCPSGQDCVYNCPTSAEYVCATAVVGTAKHGDLCNATAICERGTVCVGMAGGIARCLKFCNTDADCPVGKTCPPDSGLVCPAKGVTVGQGLLCSL